MVLIQLSSDGRLRFDEWKTPGDYMAELAGNPALGEPFEEFVSDFTSVAFGRRPPDRAAVDRLLRRARALGVPS